jgi:hypothetical protein
MDLVGTSFLLVDFNILHAFECLGQASIQLGELENAKFLFTSVLGFMDKLIPGQWHPLSLSLLFEISQAWLFQGNIKTLKKSCNLQFLGVENIMAQNIPGP